VVVWSESEPYTGRGLRLRLATLGWDTPLGAGKPPSVPQPSAFTLSAYPNPFNSTLRIEYALPHAQNIELAVFNLLGQKVTTLVAGAKPSGEHDATWSPQIGTGIYFVTLKTAEAVRTSKVVYLR